MKYLLRKSSVFVFLSVFAVNCYSFNSYTTAKAIGLTPKGRAQVRAVIDFAPQFSLVTIPSGVSLTIPFIPWVVDFTVRFSLSNYSANIKYQFLRGYLNMAAELGASFTPNSMWTGYTSSASYGFALLTTLDITPWLSLTLAPKFIITNQSSTQDQYGYEPYQNRKNYYYGGTVTLDLGKRVGIMPEFTYKKEINGPNELIWFGIGLRFGGYVPTGQKPAGPKS